MHYQGNKGNNVEDHNCAGIRRRRDKNRRCSTGDGQHEAENGNKYRSFSARRGFTGADQLEREVHAEDERKPGDANQRAASARLLVASAGDGATAAMTAVRYLRTGIWR